MVDWHEYVNDGCEVGWLFFEFNLILRFPPTHWKVKLSELGNLAWGEFL